MRDTVKIPIETQVRAADADLAHREREYPSLIANGRMTREQAEADLAIRRAIVATLVLVQRFEQPIRDVCLRRLSDIRAIERHPAAEAIREAFPDAQFIIHDLPTGSDTHFGGVDAVEQGEPRESAPWPERDERVRPQKTGAPSA